jgi:anti-sigma regulatory factor (Ser/Thr protein kinase)
MHLPATPMNVRAARMFLMKLLEAAGLEALEDTAGLCATELLTNVLRHTDSPDLCLAVQLAEKDVWISVRDDSATLPSPLRALPEASAGRGMLIINALVNEWGVDYDPEDGKSVWMRLARN